MDYQIKILNLLSTYFKIKTPSKMSKTTEFSASSELLSQLYEFSIVKNYKTGDVILDENARIRSIPIVTKGSIKVMRTEEDGREILLYYIKAGESCVMSFLGGLHGETSKVKAEVEEDAEILFLPTEKVTSLIKTHPEWLDYILNFTTKGLKNC
jgi:CRP/FNR family transcriptional regulator